MKYEANFTAASTQETSPFYNDVLLIKGHYRVIRGKETRRYAGQYIVQRLEGEKWRNLSYHLDWRSIELRYGAWLGDCQSSKRKPIES
jgi:hypothetical protein